MFSLSELPYKLVKDIGQINSIEYPPQGMSFQVAILNTEQGRFVLKVARTPSAIRELANEARILTALQDHAPFVAQPLADASVDNGHAFFFTYVEGEPLHVVLQRVPVQKRRHLVVQYAQALRRVHSWKPGLPVSEDWLTETLNWLSTHILARSPETPVSGTNSRFDGMPARPLLAGIQAWRHNVSNDTVFGHYDYCLPNVLVQNGNITGIIDWSGGGYIDRRFDLATALFSLRLTEALQEPPYLTSFLEAYGYAEPLESLYFFEVLHALTCAFWQYRS